MNIDIQIYELKDELNSRLQLMFTEQNKISDARRFKRQQGMIDSALAGLTMDRRSEDKLLNALLELEREYGVKKALLLQK